jgi:hypothetical protein
MIFVKKRSFFKGQCDAKHYFFPMLNTKKMANYYSAVSMVEGKLNINHTRHDQGTTHQANN